VGGVEALLAVINDEYGTEPDFQLIQQYGKSFLQGNFPNLTYIKRCRFEQESDTVPLARKAVPEGIPLEVAPESKADVIQPELELVPEPEPEPHPPVLQGTQVSHDTHRTQLGKVGTTNGLGDLGNLDDLDELADDLDELEIPQVS
jgi:hypothetical protein